MRVPHTELKPDTLIALIESFVAREGTDYGSVERTMESKIHDVMRQLEDGTAFVTYDEESDSASIVARDAKPTPPPPPPEGPSLCREGAQRESRHGEGSQGESRYGEDSQEPEHWGE